MIMYIPFLLLIFVLKFSNILELIAYLVFLIVLYRCLDENETIYEKIKIQEKYKDVLPYCVNEEKEVECFGDWYYDFVEEIINSLQQSFSKKEILFCILSKEQGFRTLKWKCKLSIFNALFVRYENIDWDFPFTKIVKKYFKLAFNIDVKDVVILSKHYILIKL